MTIILNKKDPPKKTKMPIKTHQTLNHNTTYHNHALEMTGGETRKKKNLQNVPVLAHTYLVPQKAANLQNKMAFKKMYSPDFIRFAATHAIYIKPDDLLCCLLLSFDLILYKT